MTGLRIAELCAGYGGLGMAVQSVLGGEIAFVADNDPGASAILAHRFPGVPNHGDITAADWSAVGPVDILAAGFPCTDVSAAGKRAGLLRGNRSGIWLEVATAISVLRPALVVIENVRGLLTARGDEPADEHLKAEAARDAYFKLSLLDWLETEQNIALAKGNSDRARRCATRIVRLMGLRRRAVARCQWHERRLVRAIGTVLGSLADLGYDAQWVLVSASDVGACHRRERVFILAWPARNAQGGRRDDRVQHGVEPGALGARVASQGDAGGVGGDAADTERDGLEGCQPAARTTTGRPAAASIGRGPAVSGATPEDPYSAARGERGQSAPGQAESGRPRADAGGSGGAPAPADAGGPGLEVGPVEPDRDERPAAERSRGDDAPADAEGERHGDAGPQGERRFPAAAVPGAPADPAAGGRRPGQPGLPEGQSDADRLPAADAACHGRDEGRPEPAGIIGGPDAALGGHGSPADPDCGRFPELEERDSGTDAGISAPCGDDAERHVLDWGPYGLAIRRWEAATGRTAPRPTEPGRTGQRLSPRFVEWMQGLPAGWVTDVPGLSRNAQLHALGNGVVPAQAAMALRLLLDRAGIPSLVAASTAIAKTESAA